MSERTVKAYLITPDGCNEEIRRFGLDVSYGFDTFMLKIKTAFTTLKGKSFKVTWQDEEGDDIVISSDDELSEALRHSNTKDVFKIYIHCACTSPAGCGGSRKTCNKMPLHPNVLCNECNGQIRGKRFKCFQCFNYDLCHDCWNVGKHNHHMLAIIPNPTNHVWYDFDPSTRHSGHKDSPPSTSQEHPQAQDKNPEFHDSIKKPVAEMFDLLKNFCPSAFIQNPMPGGNGASAGQMNGADYLNTIGQNISTLLNNWGINATVDIEHPGKENVNIPKEGPTATKASTEVKTPTNASTNAKDSQAPAAANNAKDSQTPAAANNTKDSQTQAAANNASVPEAETDSPPSTSCSGSKDDGWTMVSEALSNIETEIKKVGSSGGGSGNPLYPNPKMAEIMANLMEANSNARSEAKKEVSSAATGPAPSQTTFHPDPKISEAMAQMIQMGFSNDGNWLLPLVEAKGGNIGAILDSLHPSQP